MEIAVLKDNLETKSPLLRFSELRIYLDALEIARHILLRLLSLLLSRVLVVLLEGLVIQVEDIVSHVRVRQIAKTSPIDPLPQVPLKLARDRNLLFRRRFRALFLLLFFL